MRSLLALLTLALLTACGGGDYEPGCGDDNYVGPICEYVDGRWQPVVEFNYVNGFYEPVHVVGPVPDDEVRIETPTGPGTL